MYRNIELEEAHRPTILLVDDLPTNLDVVVESLETEGYEVLVAQDGYEALLRATDVMPDLILLDVMMPGIDGFEVCRLLKADERTRDIPVIFMTSLSSLEDKVKGFEAGAVDYITKPLQIDEVRVRVSTHLKLRLLQKSLIENNLKLQREVNDRKRAEVLLRESEERYVQIFDNSQDNIYLLEVTEDGRFLHLDINQAYVDAIGAPKESFAGVYLDEISDETIRQTLRKKYQACLDAGEMIEYESEFDLPSGHRIYQSKLSPIRDQTGRITRIVGIARDITERKRHEEALRQRAELEQRMSQLAASAPGLMFTSHLGLDGNISMPFASSAIDDLFGLQPDDVLQSIAPVQAAIHPDDRAQVAQTIHRSACTLSFCNVEFRVVHPTKGMIWVEARSIPGKQPDGSILWHGFMLDISRRKQVEALLQKREVEFRALSENSPDPIYRYDRDCRRIYVNPAVEKISGIPAAGLLGKTPEEALLVPSAENVKVMQSIQRVLATGKSDDIEVLFVAPDGRELYFQNRHVPEFAADGSVESVLSLGRDVTERRQHEALLVQRVELEQRMSRFISNAPGFFYTARLYPDGRSVMPFTSPRIKELFGLSSEDVAQNLAPLFAMGYPEDIAVLLVDRAESARNLTPLHGEFRIVHPKKGERWIELNSIPQREDDGSTVWHGLMQDVTERKCMEQALAVREHAFRNLAENSPDTIIRYDRDARRVYVNRAVCCITGKSREALLGHAPDAGQIVVSEQSRKLMEGIRRVFESGENVRVDMDVIKPDGELHYFDTLLVPEHTPDGQMASVLGVGHDITTIRKNERQLTRYFANMPGFAFTFRLSPEGHASFPFSSPGIENVYGLHPDDIKNDAAPLHALAHPDDMQHIETAIAESARSMTPLQVESRVCPPGMPERWIETRSIPLREADGSIVWQGLILDITERKLMEDELRRREEEFRVLVECSPDAIVRYDSELRRIYINSAWEKVNGIPVQEALGKRPSELSAVISASVQEFESKLRRILASGNPEEMEIGGVNASGNLQYFAMRMVPESGKDGKVASVFTVANNVTERKRMEEALIVRERDFRSLAENMPDNIARWDTAGRYLFVNPVHERTLEKSAGELIGTLLPESHQHVHAAISQVVASRQATHAVRQPVVVDGIEELHDVSLVPEFDESGELVSVLGIGRNMTETYHMQDTIAAREQEFRTLAENLPDIIIRYDRECRRIYTNLGLMKLSGQSVGEMQGKSPLESSVIVNIADYMVALNAAMETAAPVNLEFEVRRAGGETEWHSAILVPEFGNNKEVCSVLAVARNITERKLIEDALKNSYHALEEAQRIGHIGSWDVDMVNDVLTWSDETFRIWEIDREKFAATFEAFLNTVHPEDQELVTRTYNESVSNRTHYEVEHRLLFPDGRIKYILERGEPYFDADGKPVRFVGTALDITERKTMERQLDQERTLLRAFFGTLPGLAWMKDMEGCYLVCNPMFEQFFGAQEAQIIGKTDFDFVDAKLATFFREKDKAAEAAGGACVNEEWVTFASDGRRVLLETVKAPVYGADGKITGIIGVSHDITERKRMDETLKLNEAKHRESSVLLKAVLESSPEIIVFALDCDCRYLTFNEQHRETMRAIWGKEISPGMSMLEVIGDHSDCEVARRAFERALSGESFVEERAYGDEALARQYWQTFWSPIRAETGEVTGLTCFVVSITERKRMEEALLELNTELSATLHAIPDLLFEVDKQGRYLNVWAHDPGLLEMQKEKLIGHTINEMFPGEAAEVLMSSIHEADKCGYSHGQVICIELPQGTSWFELSTSAKRGVDGQAHSFMTLSRDITAHKFAELRLQQAHEFTERVINSIPDPLFVKDRQHNWLMLNDAFCSFIGHSREALLGKSDYDFFPKEQADVFWGRDEQVFGDWKIDLNEEEFTDADGSRHWIQTKKTPCRANDDRDYLVGVIRDITERKEIELKLQENFKSILALNSDLEQNARNLEEQAVELEMSKEQLQQTEAWYRSILHSAPDGMLIVDSRGLIMQVNAQLERMFGYDGGELPGCHIEVLIPKSARADHVGQRNEFISSGLKDRRMARAANDLLGFRKDGSEFPVDVSLSRLPDLDGRGGAICAAVRDVTERQRMDTARESALAEALRLAQLRSAFLAQMSHELRTPLNGILGYAQNLLQGQDIGEKQTSGLTIIRQSGEHLLSLINGILDHASIEADKMELVHDDIPLENFLSTIIGIIRVRAEQKDIAFYCEVDANLPTVIRGDAQRLRQVLLNLLANAVKFTDHGQVSLQVSQADSFRMRFAVRDSGIGIGAGEMGNIFLPFEQAGEASRKASGTGLGLAISSKLVRLMGGDIEVESQPGFGSTFSFEIDMEEVETDLAKINVTVLEEQAKSSVVPILQMRLLPPPQQELEALYALAQRGSMRDIIQYATHLIELDERYRPFAEQLRLLARGYQTRAILNLVEQYRDGKV